MLVYYRRPKLDYTVNTIIVLYSEHTYWVRRAFALKLGWQEAGPIGAKLCGCTALSMHAHGSPGGGLRSDVRVIVED